MVLCVGPHRLGQNHHPTSALGHISNEGAQNLDGYEAVEIMARLPPEVQIDPDRMVRSSPSSIPPVQRRLAACWPQRY